MDADDLAYRKRLLAVKGTPFNVRGLLKRLDVSRTYFHEQSLIRKVARTLVCSERDLRRIRSRKKSLVPNGIDLPDAMGLWSDPRPDTVVFVGNFRYEPNTEGLRWFVTEVWPLLRVRVPQVRMNVIGRRGTREGLHFANRPGIEIIGEVPETLSWVSGATVSVVPLLRGTGTRVKILESMACGRPVVSTTMGADALDCLGEDQGVYRHDSPEGMAQKIADILGDPSSALRSAEKGRQLVQERFSWEKTTATLADDIENWVTVKSNGRG